MQISFWVKLFTALHYDDVQHFMWGFLQIARPDVKADVAVTKRHQRLNQILIFFFTCATSGKSAKLFTRNSVMQYAYLRNLTQSCAISMRLLCVGGVHTAYIPDGFVFYIGNKVRYMFIY